MRSCSDGVKWGAITVRTHGREQAGRGAPRIKRQLHQVLIRKCPIPGSAKITVAAGARWHGTPLPTPGVTLAHAWLRWCHGEQRPLFFSQHQNTMARSNNVTVGGERGGLRDSTAECSGHCLFRRPRTRPSSQPPPWVVMHGARRRIRTARSVPAWSNSAGLRRRGIGGGLVSALKRFFVVRGCGIVTK